MQERYTRLARIVALFEVETRLHQARSGRFARDESALATRAKELLGLLAGPESVGLARATADQISRSARDRAAIGAKLEAESAAQRKAELRARVAEQALAMVKLRIDDRTQRALLEEMQFVAPSASRKSQGPKV
ncbi:MAG: hypothetical protein QM651_02300 [Rhodoblastus sp.]